MILERGDMWSIFNETDIFMITTNPIIRKDGAVVMGRGIAKETKDRFPGLPYKFAEFLEASGFSKIGMIGEYEDTDIWWFMVKDHWREHAKLEIIKESVDLVHKIRSNFRVDLNFPGIGNGGLKREDVLPLLEDLPDNVHIWEKAN